MSSIELRANSHTLYYAGVACYAPTRAWAALVSYCLGAEFTAEDYSCGRIRVPPQRICVVCFVEGDGWVAISTWGVLLAHTWVRKPKPHHPSVDLLINGVIRVDGVDSKLIHLVHTDDPGALAHGIRVRAIFSEKRRAHVLDIMHFSPVLRATGKETIYHAGQV